MNKNYTDPLLEEYDDEDINIDFIGIGIKILKKWKPICAIGIICGIIGIVMALRTTTMWTVTATLAPESQRNSSNINTIASRLGIGGLAGNSTSDALNMSFFPQICKSIPFLTSLFDVEVHPNVLDAEGNPTKTVTVFDHMTGKDKPMTKKQIRKIEKAKAEGTYVEPDNSKLDIAFLTGAQSLAVSKLSSSISASFDSKNGFTKVNVTMDDPRIATELTDTVLTRLQEYVIAYRTKKAQADLDYYTKMADEAYEKMVAAQAAYAASIDYNRNAILQSVATQKERLRNEASLAADIYSQMAQQRELAKARIQEDKPVYAVVQPASQPSHPTTSRKKIVIMWGLLGGFLACAWFGVGLDIVRFLIGSVKERWNEDEEESKEA